MSQQNPKVTNIAVNAKGGVMTPITLTIMASHVQVIEDPQYNNGAQQGLQGYYAETEPGKGSAAVGPLQTWLPNSNGQIGKAFEPILFGDETREAGGLGSYVGAQGTVVLLLTTNSANAGGVLLVEYT